MMRADGKPSEDSYMSALEGKEPRKRRAQDSGSTVCTSVVPRACPQLCACVCVRVRNCPPRSETVGR